ncbi:hypothetical protein [Staphylococcus simulans]|uniref:hypothetical protein n=1 Tax=Staphylococcus simulans TaxID=1286 RepID=UPI00399A7954
MFKFHKHAIQNAKPQNVKIALFSILTFIVFLLLTGLTLQPLQQSISMFVMAMMYQSMSPQILIPVIISLIIPLAFFIFAGYHLAAGAINIIYKGIHKEKVSILDALEAFKKGSYLKAVKLALFTLLFIAILSLVRYLITQLFTLGIGSLLRSGQSYFMEHIGVYIAVQLVALTLLAIVLSFFIWTFTYIMIAYTVAYFKNRQAGAFQDVKHAFKSMKNKHHSWFKLLLGLVVLDLIVIILSTPVSQLVTFSTRNISQNMAGIITTTLLIIVIIVRILVYYLNVNAIIAFFSNVTDDILPHRAPSRQQRKQQAKAEQEKQEETATPKKETEPTDKETKTKDNTNEND